MSLNADEAVDALRAAGEPTRLRILTLLAVEELSVMEIGRILEVIEAILLVYHRLGDYQHRQRNRMKFMIKAMGWEVWKQKFDETLAEVRAEATARLDKARQTLDAERQAKVAEANARIAAKRAEADKALDTARAAARGEVATAVGNVTSRATQLVLGKSPDAAVVKRAVDTTMSGGRS